SRPDVDLSQRPDEVLEHENLGAPQEVAQVAVEHAKVGLRTAAVATRWRTLRGAPGRAPLRKRLRRAVALVLSRSLDHRGTTPLTTFVVMSNNIACSRPA